MATEETSAAKAADASERLALLNIRNARSEIAALGARISGSAVILQQSGANPYSKQQMELMLDAATQLVAVHLMMSVATATKG